MFSIQTWHILIELTLETRSRCLDHNNQCGIVRMNPMSIIYYLPLH